MKTYEVKRISGQPDWESIPVAQIDQYLWSDVRSIIPSAQLAWDEDALYVRLQAIEPHILARFTGTLDEVCKDSCLEFFFCPQEGERYFNFEVNPNGSVCAIEGITSPDGRVFGKMGHSERIGKGLYKNVPGEYDIRMFEAAVKYFK